MEDGKLENLASNGDLAGDGAERLRRGSASGKQARAESGVRLVHAPKLSLEYQMTLRLSSAAP